MFVVWIVWEERGRPTIREGWLKKLGPAAQFEADLAWDGIIGPFCRYRALSPTTSIHLQKSLACYLTVSDQEW